MRQQRIGLIMHGVTGRMGTNQHLVRSILAIREQGGLALKDGSYLMPDPILVGRNAEFVPSGIQDGAVGSVYNSLGPDVHPAAGRHLAVVGNP